MGPRPRSNRNVPYQSQPATDFDRYHMFDFPPLDRRPPPLYPRTGGAGGRPSRRRVNRNEDHDRGRDRERGGDREPQRGRRRYRDESVELHDEHGSNSNYSTFVPPVLDTARIMKSLNYLTIELDYLAAVGIVSEEQRAAIMAELPENIPVLYSKRKRRRRRSRRITCSGVRNGDQGGEENPKKKDTVDWAINVAKKFGNSAMFGLGATFAGDMMKHALKAI